MCGIFIPARHAGKLREVTEEQKKSRYGFWIYERMENRGSEEASTNFRIFAKQGEEPEIAPELEEVVTEEALIT